MPLSKNETDSMSIVFNSNFRIYSCSMTLRVKEGMEFRLPIKIANGRQIRVQIPNGELIVLDNVSELHDALYFYWIHHVKELPFEVVNGYINNVF